MKIDYVIIPFTILIGSIMYVYSEMCKVERCAKSGTIMTSGQCIKYHLNETNLAPIFEINATHCNATTEDCPPVFTGVDVQCKEKQPDRNQGVDQTPCAKDDDCDSKTCDKNILKCIGKGSGISCSSSRECKIGLYCQNATACQSQLDKGKCTSDYDCKNNMGCFNSSCLEYISIEDGTKLTKESEYEYCQSYYAIQRDGVWTCVSSDLLDADECTGTKTMCNYTYTLTGKAKAYFQKPCRCSVSSATKLFCQYGSNSAPFKNDLVPSLKSFYKGDSLKMHTFKRDYYDSNLKWKMYSIKQYPTFREADQCVRDLYAPKKGSLIYLSYALIVVLITVYLG